MDGNAFESALAKIRQLKRERRLSPIALDGMSAMGIDHPKLTFFSGNDYLGLATHPRVKRAAINALEAHGMGPRGSALMCGFTDSHERLSMKIASLKGTTCALVFPTGYQANLGLMGALGRLGGTIFSDALNHASIIDGCRLSKCKTVIYPHGDMNALEDALKVCNDTRKIVVTDEIFSMNGDRAPLRALGELKTQYGFVLVTDSAHSSGIYGPHGAGWAAACEMSDQVDFQVGTLSKAFASQGGFIACDRSKHDWLVNTARSFIFTTALPVPIAAAAEEAISLSLSESKYRDTLWDRISEARAGLGDWVNGPIIPIVVGSEEAALRLSSALFDDGFHVPAIRPPTVPEGSCRVRIALSASHSSRDISGMLETLSRQRMAP